MCQRWTPQQRDALRQESLEELSPRCGNWLGWNLCHRGSSGVGYVKAVRSEWIVPGLPLKKKIMSDDTSPSADTKPETACDLALWSFLQ
jgi:hypothetical protein